ncbi:MAG: 3-isopropylmalate dehydratase [bacterium]|jgi:3-isopropylmalate/(R)-2-methylmalate dehydratase small subunit
MNKGRIWKYGDDINTDVIFPGKYTYTVTDPAEMAAHALEDLDSAFAAGVAKGDIVVAGKNFGCGSSREQAAICLVASGVSAVVAKSFARIYFRNAINCGLMVIACPAAVDAAEHGGEMEIDEGCGVIRVSNREFAFPPFPPQVRKILDAGGLIPYTKARIAGAEI